MKAIFCYFGVFAQNVPFIKKIPFCKRFFEFFFRLFKYWFLIFVFIWEIGELRELCEKFRNFWITIDREIIFQSWRLLTPFFNFPIVQCDAICGNRQLLLLVVISWHHQQQTNNQHHSHLSEGIPGPLSLLDIVKFSNNVAVRSDHSARQALLHLHHHRHHQYDHRPRHHHHVLHGLCCSTLWSSLSLFAFVKPLRSKPPTALPMFQAFSSLQPTTDDYYDYQWLSWLS